MEKKKEERVQQEKKGPMKWNRPGGMPRYLVCVLNLRQKKPGSGGKEKITREEDERASG